MNGFITCMYYCVYYVILSLTACTTYIHRYIDTYIDTYRYIHTGTYIHIYTLYTYLRAASQKVSDHVLIDTFLISLYKTPSAVV